MMHEKLNAAAQPALMQGMVRVRPGRLPPGPWHLPGVPEGSAVKNRRESFRPVKIFDLGGSWGRRADTYAQLAVSGSESSRNFYLSHPAGTVTSRA
jgi:hypothetical protein